MRHAQFHAACNFLSKTNTACAMDAATHLFHADEGPYIFMKHHAFFFVIAGSTATIAHRQILQLALATLVANRAVKRVVDQQKLHD